MASRMVFCWYRKPGLVPGSTSNQVTSLVHQQAHLVLGGHSGP